MSNGERRTDVKLQRKRFERADHTVPLPLGLKLESSDEGTVWHQYTSARSAKDWIVSDLLIIHRLVKLEVNLRNEREKLAEEGTVIFNTNGNPVKNPRFSIVMEYESKIMSVVRTLQLAAPSSTPMSRAKDAREDQLTKAAIEENALSGLIAMPTNTVQ